MYPKSSSSPAKSAIDQDFFEHLKQLAQARGPLKPLGKIPEAPKPTMTIGVIRQSPLRSLQDAAADIASSEPKLKRSPKISRIFDSKSVGQVACPCPDNQDPVPVVSVAPLALKASGSSRAVKNGRSASPSPRGQNAKDESRRSSPRISPASSQVPSPRGSGGEKLSVASVSSPSSSAASSVESSPATTPREQTIQPEQISKARKLARKATGSLGEFAEALRNKLAKNSKGNIAGKNLSRPSSGGNSPRVRFSAANDIDEQVDLADPAFKTFVHRSVREGFMNAWGNEKVGAELTAQEKKKYGKFLTDTLIRDFKNSTYRFRNNNGDSKVLKELDEFIDCLRGDSNPHQITVVSHILTQNLTLFLKHVLFERTDDQNKTHSALMLSDGTPLVPVARFKAAYELSKDDKGNIIIDYQCNISSNDDNSMKVRISGHQDLKKYLVSDDAKLTMSTRITVAPDGDWHIANPRVQASGWNLIESL